MDDDEFRESLGDLGANPMGGPGLLDALTRWAAAAQVDEAARARAQERWLQQQASEETTFVSVLADLSERAKAVLVHTSAGHHHRGRVRALGVDFAVLGTGAGTDVLIATNSISSVRTQPGDALAQSGRMIGLHLHLADAMLAMAADRPRVTVTTSDNSTVNGNLVSVGRDVITVRIDGDTRSNVYIPVGSVCEIALASG